ncbi:MAG TPA: ABC transporter permease subunit [Ramlibacter sp.]|uniref:ABC transporter permease n=1 Tax=Ramlibacter sp. TaxID=1917967 RepID=UPI002BBF591F|nr:ABC transporter permease subunit [Ramlibacter sp.]HVZ45836.1 ABC transporter permease subunit [Ramlibacter sp.]
MRVSKLLRALVFPAALLAALEVYTRTAGAASDALAPPSAAARALAAAFFSTGESSLWQATAFTLGSAALGLLLGAALGIGLGILLGLSRRAAHMSFLSVEVLRPVPSVALIPLAMLVFGFGLRMEVSVVAFATFWPMLILAQAAASQVEPALLEVARGLGLTPLQRAAKIVLPAMVPRLFVALRLGVAIALVVAVTVEIAANPNGMGYAIMIAQQSMEPALMLAWLFWIGVVGYAINAGAMRLQRWAGQRMGVPAAADARIVE